MRQTLFLTTIAALVLTACGGASDNGPDVSNPNPGDSNNGSLVSTNTNPAGEGPPNAPTDGPDTPVSISSEPPPSFEEVIDTIPQ